MTEYSDFLQYITSTCANNWIPKLLSWTPEMHARMIRSHFWILRVQLPEETKLQCFSIVVLQFMIFWKTFSVFKISKMVKFITFLRGPQKTWNEIEKHWRFVSWGNLTRRTQKCDRIIRACISGVQESSFRSSYWIPNFKKLNPKNTPKNNSIQFLNFTCPKTLRYQFQSVNSCAWFCADTVKMDGISRLSLHEV